MIRLAKTTRNALRTHPPTRPVKCNGRRTFAEWGVPALPAPITGIKLITPARLALDLTGLYVSKNNCVRFLKPKRECGCACIRSWPRSGYDGDEKRGRLRERLYPSSVFASGNPLVRYAMTGSLFTAEKLVDRTLSAKFHTTGDIRERKKQRKKHVMFWPYKNAAFSAGTVQSLIPA